MKYSEFKLGVEQMGYTYHDGMVGVHIHNSVGEVAIVGKDGTHIVSTSRGAFRELGELEKGRLLNICHKLSKTPLADREEEKRYRLKLVNTLISDQDETYLNLQEGRDKPYWFIGSKTEIFGAKTIFTESELAEMDIAGFVKDEEAE